ncbi:carbon monoxide dehydrogenase medium chain [Candidatus Moduliflexus flocculans]|uniref:Carbon monoxide dehydrogenase medium chain n=1 Tax=Candidatus Moduliflexus flocculans TaxID=1499966 RepID=A0A0S6VVQ6_9BACT|nr:carbon monoxide dehydrogenase medium chain [Candidatus Moduliflexus flocculans]
MKNITAYFTPATLEEAIHLLREQPGKGKLIAGGTNIVVEKDPTLDFLVDVRQLGLDYLNEDDERIYIGAATHIETLYRSMLMNSLASGMFTEMCSWFASKQIRNMATIGGNIADGHSAADTIPPLLALDAQIVLRGETERVVAIVEFLKPEGGSVIQPHELITEIRLPKIFQQASGAFLKNSKTREDISVVSVTTTMIVKEQRCDVARIALGAVAPIPVRIPAAEAALVGQTLTPELIEQAADIVTEQIHPLTNFRGSAEFRKEIARVYTKRALQSCWEKFVSSS